MTNSRDPARSAPAEINTNVTVHGDVSGQLAVGQNILQMRIDRVVGNVVTVLPAGSAPRISPRSRPIRILPRRPVPMFDRQDETAQVIEWVAAEQAVEVTAPSGAGKSTLLRHLAHEGQVAEACGGVAHLSVRGCSRDDLLQEIFEVFYRSDVPVKPSPVELRHRLQSVRAALLLDDLGLPEHQVEELEDFAPQCAFVVAVGRPEPVARLRSLNLGGLPPDDAARLFVHALGRALLPEERPSAATICGLAGGHPGRLVHYGSSARQFTGSLSQFAAEALAYGPPAIAPESSQDVRWLGLLAAVPGVQLDARQLAAISELPDVQQRLDRYGVLGLVVASDPAVGEVSAPPTYSLSSSGVALGVEGWDLDKRRAELHAYFAALARSDPHRVLAPRGPADTVRSLQSDAREHGEWRSVLAYGVLLDAVYAGSGRWDAWHDVLHASLEAARALGDSRAEAMALHQLGTRALCLGDLQTAAGWLTAALDLRTSAGDTAAAQVTRHNLNLITAPPPPPQDSDEPGSDSSHNALAAVVSRMPAVVKVLAALVPLVGLLVLKGWLFSETAHADPQSVAFAAQAVNQASAPQNITLASGSQPMRIDHIATSGPHGSEFTVMTSTCLNEIPAGQTCTTTVVFTPTDVGERQATLIWDVEDLDNDPVTTLTGEGRAPDPVAPSVTPASLVFEPLPLNTGGPPQQVRLVAPTTGPIEVGSVAIEGVHAADFLLEDDSCSAAVLRAGAACTQSVRFTPSAEGEHGALLVITGVGGDRYAAVPLSGTGLTLPAEQDVAVAPASLTFGDQTVGTTSAPQQVTLSNRGQTPVDVAAVTTVGGPDFTIVENTCGSAIPPGAECTVATVFTPAEVGQHTAQLVVHAPGSPTIPLRGVGVPAQAGAPELSPAIVDFGSQQVGKVSAPKNVTVTNRAAAPLRLAGLSVAGENAGFKVDAAACTGATIQAQATCVVPVRFAPTTAGTHSGVLGLSVEGAPGRSTVVLIGTATDPKLPQVPDVIGLVKPKAEQVLKDAGLTLGQVTQAPHPDAPPGVVIDQSPRPSTPVARGDSVDIVVSSGPETIPVPKLVGMQRAAAEQRLAGAGLGVGQVAQRADPEAAAGVVLETDPKEDTPVLPGSPVNLVVSSGPDVVLVRVPPVRGEPLENARALIEGVGLKVGTVTQGPSDTVKQGYVIGSTPAAGEEVKSGSEVGLKVSSGPASVIVPNVVGMLLAEAKTAITDAHLTVGEDTLEYSDTVKEGYVISATPPAGKEVPSGSPIALTVSRGPEPIEVPNVVGLSEKAAGEALRGHSLKKGQTSTRPDSTAPAGIVVEQNPPPKSRALAGSPVNFVISSGPKQVEVPYVVGKTYAEAERDIKEKGLTVTRIDTYDSNSNPPPVSGTVISTTPAGGAQVDKDSEVEVTVYVSLD